jgi:hypothetical protein
MMSENVEAALGTKMYVSCAEICIKYFTSLTGNAVNIPTEV